MDSNEVKYEYFIAGRTRNKDAILAVRDVLRDAGKSYYCFLENEYESDGVEFKDGVDPETSMRQYEAIKDWRNNKLVRDIFEADMNALKASEKLILVLPAGKSGHIEAGAAYGMNKPLYAVGIQQETESLYLIFDEIFDDADKLKEFVEGNNG